MPDFKCRILHPDGREEVMEIGAASEHEAVEILKRDGLFVLEVTGTGGSGSGSSGLHREVNINPADLFFRVKRKDIVLVIRQLAVLLESGISIVRALDSLARQSRSRGMRKLLTGVRDDVEAGHGFSEALAANGKVFKHYIISMVRAAESSGELDVIMNTVADKLEEEAAFKRHIITALIYPTMLLGMALLVVMLLGLFIIPKFAPMLGDAGKQIPWPTRFVMDGSDWIKIHWKHVIGGLVGTFVLLGLLRRTERGGYAVDLVLLRVPVIGKIIRSGAVVTFSTNLATLYASGVPISDALQTVRDTLSNGAVARVVDGMIDSILSGGAMVEPLHGKEHIFPPMVAEMLATGEQTGEMEKALLLLAKIFRTLLESFVKQMTALIEPLMIMILGGIVGFVFYALITGVLAVYGV
jgi:type II secretory pathway component PulF